MWITYAALKGEKKRTRFNNLHAIVYLMLPNQFIFDQAVGAQEIGAYGAILDEANDARMLFLPVRVSIAFRLVDLHNGSVQSLQRCGN